MVLKAKSVSLCVWIVNLQELEVLEENETETAFSEEWPGLGLLPSYEVFFRITLSPSHMLLSLTDIFVAIIYVAFSYG